MGFLVLGKPIKRKTNTLKWMYREHTVSSSLCILFMTLASASTEVTEQADAILSELTSGSKKIDLCFIGLHKRVGQVRRPRSHVSHSIHVHFIAFR
jgi:hypothetical protein